MPPAQNLILSFRFSEMGIVPAVPLVVSVSKEVADDE